MDQLEHSLPITLDLIICVFILRALNWEHTRFGQHRASKDLTELIC